MQGIMFKVFRWLLGASQVKFVSFTALFAVMNYLATSTLNLIEGYISTSSLSTAFGGLSSNVWYFLDMFNVSYGCLLYTSRCV